MSENDATRDDAEHRSLSAALTDLATTMPDQSYPVDVIHAKGRQVRKRQRAARATVSAVAGVAVIAALLAMLPDRSPVPTPPASGQVPIAEPSCADALAAAPPPPTPEEVRATVAAKQAAAGGAVTNLRGIKGLGTIVSATDSTVTITPDPQMTDQQTPITATVSPTAEFYDGDTKVDARPSLSPGDQVAFAATRADDGSYELMLLNVHLPEPAPTADSAVRPGKSATEQQAASSDGYVKAAVEVVSVQPDSLTIRFTDGERAGQVVTAALGPDTAYRAGDQKCVDPVLTTGQQVGVLLASDASGAFTVDTVAFETPPPPKPAGP